MYDYISGKLVTKALDYACIDVNGVGYILYIPFKTYENLNEINSFEKLYTYLHVKEDDMRLYGFKTITERSIFKKVISVSGIGPKIALAILSVYTPGEISSMVLSDDYKMLSKVNGLGVKKAQKLIIELKDKLDDIEAIETNTFKLHIVKNEIKLALEALGYVKLKIEDYITDEEINEVRDSGKLMKEILKKLSKKK